jgi:hypothetical protein
MVVGIEDGIVESTFHELLLFPVAARLRSSSRISSMSQDRATDRKLTLN